MCIDDVIMYTPASHTADDGLSHSFRLQMYPLQQLNYMYKCPLVPRLPVLSNLSLAHSHTSINAHHVEPEMAHGLATPRYGISLTIYSISQILKSPISFRDQPAKFNARQIFPLYDIPDRNSEYYGDNHTIANVTRYYRKCKISDGTTGNQSGIDTGTPSNPWDWQLHRNTRLVNNRCSPECCHLDWLPGWQTALGHFQPHQLPCSKSTAHGNRTHTQKIISHRHGDVNIGQLRATTTNNYRRIVSLLYHAPFFFY